MAVRIGSPKIKKAYEFLVQVDLEERIFTRSELSTASGWTETTTKANLSKKLNAIVIKVDGGFRAIGVRKLTEDAFCRMCSQNSSLANDPQRPRLEPKVEGLIIKAREAALAAVQNYNNPTAMFRTGNYIVLMTIAYTSLFHAVFLKDGVDYIAYDKNGNPKLVNGEPMLWDVVKCVEYYRENYNNKYGGNFLKAVSKNIEFFLPLRHKIEHRFMPEIDVEIGGHCQSMLLNFESIITKEFTIYYSLNMSLSLALQFSTGRSTNTVEALRRLQSAEYQDLKQQITAFHNGLPDDIIGDPAFAFRMWLVPKTANHARSADLSVEFVPINELTAERVAELEKSIIAFKTVTKEKFIDPAQECNMWENEVVRALKEILGTRIEFGEISKEINGAMIRDIVKAHKIESPSSRYYRPNKPGSRAMYGRAIVDWIADEYNKNHRFFIDAKIVAQSVDQPKTK